VARIRRQLDDRPADRSVPQLESLRRRPSLEDIVFLVGKHFKADAARWSAGCRGDDASRAVAAYLARREFGYSCVEVAKALGYRTPSSVTLAVGRVEAGTENLRKTAKKLRAVLH